MKTAGSVNVDFHISTKQAQKIASYIVADVAAYVASHPVEFEAFKEREANRHGQERQALSDKSL